MANTIEVPARGRKWVTGALVRDEMTHQLYRVSGPPVRYHEDCLPFQRVARVRDVPEEWKRVMRLLEIQQTLERSGTRAPMYAGEEGREEVPAATGEAETVSWEARRVAQSYAQFPRLEVRGDDLVVYVCPIYDDAPIVAWVRDAALAAEVRTLIASGAQMLRYPSGRVRVRKGGASPRNGRVLAPRTQGAPAPAAGHRRSSGGGGVMTTPEQNETIEAQAARERYLALPGAGTEHENAVLSAGREFLPQCARDVLDGVPGAASPEYWDFLASQLEEST